MQCSEDDAYDGEVAQHDDQVVKEEVVREDEVVGLQWQSFVLLLQLRSIEQVKVNM